MLGAVREGLRLRRGFCWPTMLPPGRRYALPPSLSCLPVPDGLRAELDPARDPRARSS